MSTSNKNNDKNNNSSSDSDDDGSNNSLSTSATAITTETKTSHLGGAMAGTESSFYEALQGLLGGMIYGLVSPLVGHPLDTIKTKMQAAPQYAHASAWTVVRDVWKTEGISGFYRGFLPPLLGSTAYRGILFSAYAGTFAACEHVEALSQPIPYTGGLRPSVLVGSVAASVARATIESPLDFLKVRSQLKQSALAGTELLPQNAQQSSVWSWKGLQNVLASVGRNPVGHVLNLYNGFTPTLFRTMGLLGTFFVLVDYSVRYLPEVMNAPLLGPFFKGGVCATLAWVPAFPMETAKSVIQAEASSGKNLTTRQVLAQLYREKGIVGGWYRGFGPGAGRSFVANGTSMIVYSWYQETTRSWIRPKTSPIPSNANSTK